jgi:sugar lactone lactonase YvrE
MRFIPVLSALLASGLAAKVHIVYQFPLGTWLENTAATRNGSLLVSTIGAAEVHIVHPSTTPPSSSVLATFPDANAVLGMAEIHQDVFAVAVGTMTPENVPIAKSFSIWSIDLSCKDEKEKVKKIADIHDVSMVNGMAALNSHTLLLADSWAGNVVAFDTNTKKSEIVFEHPTLLPDFNASLPLGVNGLKIQGEYVYYTNSVQRLVGRIRIHTSTGKPNGPFMTLASGSDISVPDDLLVAKDGSVYVSAPLAAPQGDTLQHITLDGKVTTIAHDGPVAGTTAPTFGRTETDKNVIYLSTMGGFGEDGSPKAGGRVVAVALD